MKKLLIFLITLVINNQTFAQNFEEIIIVESNIWLQPKVIDLDNDGLDDFVSVSIYGNIAWWKKDSSSNLTKNDIDKTVKSWRDFDVFDIDGDSDLDILVSERNSIEIYYNDGNQNFTPTYINGNYSSSNIIAGDFDSDGYIDFVTTSGSFNGSVVLWKNELNTFHNYNKITIALAGISCISLAFGYLKTS